MNPDGGSSPVPLSTLQIGLSNRCDRRCRICIQSAEKFRRLPERWMDETVFAAILQGLIRGLRPDSLQLFWNDEPTLHPRFADWWPQFVDAVARDFAGELLLSTHGGRLESLASLLAVPDPRVKLILSLDAATPATYARLRGGDFAALERGLAALLAARGKADGPRIIYQMVLTPWNVDEIDLFIEFCRCLHRDACGRELPFTMKVPDFQEDVIYLKCPFPWENEDESARAREWFIQEARERGFPRAVVQAVQVARPRCGRVCSHALHGLVVHPDGQVSPCCLDFDALVSLGQLRPDHDLYDLATGPARRALQAAMARGGEQELPARCRACLLPG